MSMEYVGNCKNSFDLEGDCIVPQLPYRDVSHFAVSEDIAKLTSREAFEKQIPIPEELQKLQSRKNTVYMHDVTNGVYMMYDSQKDVHYFFV